MWSLCGQYSIWLVACLVCGWYIYLVCDQYVVGILGGTAYVVGIIYGQCVVHMCLIYGQYVVGNMVGSV